MASVNCLKLREHLRDFPGCSSQELAAAFNTTANNVRSLLTFDLNRGILEQYRKHWDNTLRYRLVSKEKLLRVPSIKAAWELLDSVGLYVETEGTTDD